MASAQSAQNIRVAVRCRPLNKREAGESSIFTIEDGNACLKSPATGEVHRFGFDMMYDLESKQTQLWDAIGVPTLDNAFKGFNGTIFAYGQTGSGKTFSMQGVRNDPVLTGVIPRMCSGLFERIDALKAGPTGADKLFLVTCSYFELYNEVIRDLLDPANMGGSGVGKKKRAGAGLSIKEHKVLGIYVDKLNEVVVDRPSKMEQLIDQGQATRTVAATAMNAESSRSHSVFTIKLAQKDASDDSKNIFAKINLVDLAGSERSSKTGATGDTLKEGANINKSLTSLGLVINALVDVAKGKKNVFVPYRNSKLTRVLQESLGGNSLTAMLAALSPAASNYDETLSTLRYAARAKSIKLNAVKNEEASAVAKLNDEIKMLKERLAAAAVASTAGATSSAASAGGSFASAGGGAGDGGAAAAALREQLSAMQQQVSSTWEERTAMSSKMEAERASLISARKEQQAALDRERERRWQLLEAKDDLELSLHDLAQVAPALPTSEWIKATRNVLGLERTAAEQSTVVTVYWNAAGADVTELCTAAGVPPAAAADDDAMAVAEMDDVSEDALGDANVRGVPAAPLRSVSAKLGTLCEEATQLLAKQDTLLTSATDLVKAVSSALTKWLATGPPSPASEAESGEAAAAAAAAAKVATRAWRDGERGLQMIARQMAKRQATIAEAVCNARQRLLETSGAARSLIAASRAPSLRPRDAQGSAAPGADVLADHLNALQSAVDAAAIPVATPALAWGVAPPASPSPTKASSMGGPTTPSAPAAAAPTVVSDVPQASVTATASVSGSTAARAAIGAAGGGWQCDEASAADAWLQMDLGVASATVRSILTQGDGAAAAAPSAAAVAACDELPETTATALASLVDWPTMLGANQSPATLLKRPPVRFLYDVISAVAAKADSDIFARDDGPLSAFPTSASLSAKPEKLAFFNGVIDRVSAALALTEAPAAAADIVKGAAAGRTNRFVQLMVVAAQGAGDAAAADASPAAGKWVTAYTAQGSDDGVSWGSPIALSGNSDPRSVCRSKLEPAVKARYLRLKPTAWSAGGVAWRVGVEASAAYPQQRNRGTPAKTPVRASPRTAGLGTPMRLSKQTEGRFDEIGVRGTRAMALLSSMSEATSSMMRVAEWREAADRRIAENAELDRVTAGHAEVTDELRAMLDAEKQHRATEQAAYAEERAQWDRRNLMLQTENLKLDAEARAVRQALSDARSDAAAALELVAEKEAAVQAAEAAREAANDEREQMAEDFYVASEERDELQRHVADLTLQKQATELDLDYYRERLVVMSENVNELRDEKMDLEEKVHAAQTDYRNLARDQIGSEPDRLGAASALPPISGGACDDDEYEDDFDDDDAGKENAAGSGARKAYAPALSARGNRPVRPESARRRR